MRADIVIVGSGVAGLRAAIEVAGAANVVLLTKAGVGDSNTGWAQGGIAAAVGADDTPSLHASDTLAAGDGLSDEDAVDVLVTEGPGAVRELVGWGAAFDRKPDGSFELGREAAHSVRRVLHVHDATGREISRALWKHVATHVSPTVVESASVTDAIVEDGACRGVRFIDAAGERRELRARAVVLATGGAGQVFRETTNPPVATGDGIALAWRAGALVADLEFVQFHPTALSVPGRARFLLSEALRGEGARLVNQDGDAFMPRYDVGGDLAPRDRVARAIVREQARTGHPVYLTLAHLPESLVRDRFPSIAAACREVGLDLARDRIPVGPAAHYLMGGVLTDLAGRTSLNGLLAAGEVACTRVHGANRLASNSLLEGLVFGRRAGAAARAWLDGEWRWQLPDRVTTADPFETGYEAGTGMTTAAVRDLAWQAIGLFRDRDSLAGAVARLDSALAAAEDDVSADAETATRRSLVTVARLMAQAALRREESRGGHARQDFPLRDDDRWQVHVADGRRITRRLLATSAHLGRDDRSVHEREEDRGTRHAHHATVGGLRGAGTSTWYGGPSCPTIHR